MQKKQAIIFYLIGNTDAPYVKNKTETFGKGDADGNGKIQLLDANLVLKAALCIVELSQKETKSAEVDGKEDISLSDVNLILKAALRNIQL